MDKQYRCSLSRLLFSYWKGEEKKRAWGMAITIAALTVAAVYMTLLLNDWFNSFYSALQNYEQQGDESRQILVVCSSGIGTSQFLLMQLRERYPHLQFTGPFRVSEYLHLSFDEIRLILTTTPLIRRPEEPVPVLQISALPTDYEWDLLNRKLLAVGFSVSSYRQGNVQALLDLIANYARIEDAAGLSQGLQAYFQEQQPGRKRVDAMAAVAGLLKYIQLFPKNE